MSRTRMTLASTLTAVVLALAGGGAFAGTAFANGPAGTPGEPNCHGKLISDQAQYHGGIANATADHGFASVKDGQEVARGLCNP